MTRLSDEDLKWLRTIWFSATKKGKDAARTTFVEYFGVQPNARSYLEQFRSAFEAALNNKAATVALPLEVALAVALSRAETLRSSRNKADFKQRAEQNCMKFANEFREQLLAANALKPPNQRLKKSA